LDDNNIYQKGENADVAGWFLLKTALIFKHLEVDSPS